MCASPPYLLTSLFQSLVCTTYSSSIFPNRKACCIAPTKDATVIVLGAANSAWASRGSFRRARPLAPSVCSTRRMSSNLRLQICRCSCCAMTVADGGGEEGAETGEQKEEVSATVQTTDPGASSAGLA